MWQIWLIIAGICLIIEIMTVGFLIFWFAIGALLLANFLTNGLVAKIKMVEDMTNTEV